MRLVTVVVLLAGCSVALVRGPGDSHHTDCTASRTVPILDTIGAALLGGLAVVIKTAPSGGGQPAVPTDTATELSALAGVGVLVSAVYGYVKVSACRAALALPDSIRASADAAIRAARAGDCSPVAATASQLHDEPSLFMTFQNDPAVASCLADACIRRRLEVLDLAGRITDDQARAQVLRSVPDCGQRR